MRTARSSVRDYLSALLLNVFPRTAVRQAPCVVLLFFARIGNLSWLRLVQVGCERQSGPLNARHQEWTAFPKVLRRTSQQGVVGERQRRISSQRFATKPNLIPSHEFQSLISDLATDPCNIS